MGKTVDKDAVVDSERMIKLVLLSIYGTVKMATRLGIYLILGTLVVVIRLRNRKKSRKEMDKDTERLMRKTPKDANGKYPWEQ
ncbi:hypothetical protein [Lactiplantibacillus songbeiensis]|uniref:Uncharacterized protein n=1 Tax=Lactiplantibacillus songbeiensis TaxID=2559920 RepID=A0ABW4C311_9LACO|nr:hypothetical protein [Lactiplantibacillus songbeiensis]